MADATSYDSNDYTHSMHKQPSSSKPTNLDEEINDDKEPSSQDIVHEGDTPEESGAPDTPPIELDHLKEKLNTTDMSASDMTMNQNEATFLCQNTPASHSINDEESSSRIVNGETDRKLDETEEMTHSEELKTEPESEVMVDSVIKMEPESIDESENPTTVVSSETITESESQANTELESETKTEPESETRIKSDSETKTEPVIETTTEAEPESETKTETQSETKTKDESEVNNKAQSEPGTGSSVPKTDSNVIINGDSLNDRDSGISLSNSVTKPGAPHDWIDVLGNGNLLKRVSIIITCTCT